MTHASDNSKRTNPKLQLKYDPKDVLKVINTLPRDPVLDLIENSGKGRKLAAKEPVLRAYYLSQLDETWVPEKSHAVYRLLKENWRDLADQCGFEELPCWETFRKRFNLLKDDYYNETAIRQFEILRELKKADLGKKALPIIAKHREPRRRNPEDLRSNHEYRKQRIDNAVGLFELVEEAGTDELAERFFIKSRWPDGKLWCPRPGCGSDHVQEQPSDRLRQWLCLECERAFDMKTNTVFEGTRFSLRTVLLAAYLILQIPYGVAALILACLLKDEGQRPSHKAALDLTHRIQTALIESQPRFGHTTQVDDSLMGYANGVKVNTIAGVDTSTHIVWAAPILGEVNQNNSSSFIDGLVEEEVEIHTDSTKSYPEKLRPRKMVNHANNVMARDDIDGGPRISTNLAENNWSTAQEGLDRRRAVSAVYFPLFLAEHMWRQNHRFEPTLEQLQAFIRNGHDVVLRGDDKPCDVGEVEEELAIQLALHPPSPKHKKARTKKRRSHSNKKKGGAQQQMPGF